MKGGLWQKRPSKAMAAGFPTAKISCLERTGSQRGAKTMTT
jgi:hypothetical protein